MKLTFLRIRNCLSFGSTASEIQFRDLTTIVGPNNSGKTNVLRAISLVGMALQWRGLDLDQCRPYHYKGDIYTPAEVEVGIALDSDELAAISDFLTCTTLCEDPTAQSNERMDRLIDLRNELVLKYYQPGFAGLFKDVEVGLRLSYENRYSTQLYLVLRHQDAKIFVSGFYGFSLSPSQPRSCYSKTFTGIALEELLSYNHDSYKAYVEGRSDSPPKTEIKALTFELVLSALRSKDPTVLSISPRSTTDFENRIQNKAPVVSLRKFLQERGFTEDYIGLRELFSTIYNSSILRLSDMRSKPKPVQELTGNSGLAISRFAMLSGEHLPEILFALKNSAEPRHIRRYRELDEVFRKLTGLSFDVAMRTKEIEVDQNKIELDTSTRQLVLTPKKASQLVHNLQIQILQDDFPTPLDFAAAGITETLLLLTAVMGSSSKVLLLDEPALNLHPRMQRRIMEILRASVEQNRHQVVLVTHSPYFISSDQLEKAYRLVMNDDGTVVINLGEPIQAMQDRDKQKLAMKLTNADTRALMFARGAVFVEGISERMVIELIDKALSFKTRRTPLYEREWVIWDLGGKSDLAKSIDIAKKFRLDFAAILDSDALREAFHALKECGLLDAEDLEVNESSIEELRRAVRKHGIFVLKEDLEKAIGIKVGSRESKPLAILQAMSEKVYEGRVPPEIREVLEYLDSYVEGLSKT